MGAPRALKGLFVIGSLAQGGRKGKSARLLLGSEHERVWTALGFFLKPVLWSGVVGQSVLILLFC